MGKWLVSWDILVVKKKIDDKLLKEFVIKINAIVVPRCVLYKALYLLIRFCLSICRNTHNNYIFTQKQELLNSQKTNSNYAIIAMCISNTPFAFRESFSVFLFYPTNSLRQGRYQFLRAQQFFCEKIAYRSINRNHLQYRAVFEWKITVFVRERKRKRIDVYRSARSSKPFAMVWRFQRRLIVAR